MGVLITYEKNIYKSRIFRCHVRSPKDMWYWIAPCAKPMLWRVPLSGPQTIPSECFLEAKKVHTTVRTYWKALEGQRSLQWKWVPEGFEICRRQWRFSSYDKCQKSSHHWPIPCNWSSTASRLQATATEEISPWLCARCDGLFWNRSWLMETGKPLLWAHTLWIVQRSTLQDLCSYSHPHLMNAQPQKHPKPRNGAGMGCSNWVVWVRARRPELQFWPFKSALPFIVGPSRGCINKPIHLADAEVSLHQHVIWAWIKS